jgi:hypothetical protein
MQTLSVNHSLVKAGVEEEDHYALDHLCYSACFVAIGTCHFLHYEWFHPHPVGGGSHYGLDSIHSRPKKNHLIEERKHMKPITLIGIALLVLGALALAYQGINYTRTEKVFDLGPIHATAEKHERIPLPPIIGGLALAGGAVLLVVGARQKARRGSHI